MDLQQIEMLASTLMQTRETHPNYKRVVDFAKEYEAHLTGEGIENYLRRFTPRETEEMFLQRVQLTNSINPAVTNSLLKPFYKVTRNKGILKKYDFKNEALDNLVAVMLHDFNGDKVDNTNGLDMWLSTRFLELSASDPNAFVVLEWSAAPLNEAVKPRPFEVSSAEALNYEYKGAELQWLHVLTDIKYTELNSEGLKSKDGEKFTFYAQGYTITHERIDRKFLQSIGYELKPGQTLVNVGSKDYLKTIYETRLNFVPAFRVGYARDAATKGRTYVSPFHPAMPYLRKALKVTSELDITMIGHVFPQKLQYVERCEGEGILGCDNGRCTSKNAVCTVCNGSGYKTIKSAQEIITLPMPETKEEFMPLSEMLVYKSPPIDLVKFQQEYIQQLKKDTHLAVYNSNMYLTTDVQFAKTATEVDSNTEGIYDALEPMTEKFSKVWRFIVYTCAVLAGKDERSDDFTLMHEFPADPKLKTFAALLNDLKAVNDSGAPSFTRDVINNDIAQIIYNGDDDGLLRYQVKHNFFPFNGKSPEEIALIMASDDVLRETKILYTNFEAIFTELERDNPAFYFLNEKQQAAKLADKLAEYIERIGTREPMRLDFGGSFGYDAGVGEENDGENPPAGGNGIEGGNG